MGAHVTALSRGELVLHGNSEAGARPWVRMLARAGVPLTRTPNGGYLFTFAGRADLTGEDPAPTGADLAELAPEMLDLLRQMLTLYDGRQLLPMDRFPAFWQDVRAVIGKAEGAAAP